MLWEGKKLYYKNGNRPKKAQQYFNSLRLEQDIRSPHRYLTPDFDVAENDVVVDVGAAEGNFSLSVIEKVGHVFLFETDIKWIKALEATFEPWKHKVKIIQKYVSDKTDDQCIALDDFFDDKQTIHFIKADVEGAEGLVLQGATRVIDQTQESEDCGLYLSSTGRRRCTGRSAEKTGIQNQFLRWLHALLLWKDQCGKRTVLAEGSTTRG